jgi:hypothetical protein
MAKDDLDELIARVAAEHGILLDRHDPAAIIPTLVKLGIERGVQQATRDENARREELRDFMRQAKGEAMGVLEKEINGFVDKVRGELKLDLDRASASAATLVANVNHAHTRPMRTYWITMGLIAAVVLLGIGFFVGRFLS